MSKNQNTICDLNLLVNQLKTFSTADKNGDDGNAIVAIKGAMQNAQDAKKDVLDMVGSQRSYENRGSQRSDHRGSDHRGSDRGSNQYDSNNRGSNRSDGNRDFGSHRNTQNHYGNSNSNERSNPFSQQSNNTSAPQNNMDASEPMEYEMIDWQAAARESVCIAH